MFVVTSGLVCNKDPKNLPTPPHHPTFNVRLTRNEIEAIAALVWPHGKLVQVEALEFGKGFNNRIYFLTVDVRDKEYGATHKESKEHFVLKVNGHYFDELKVMNEVAVLMLLRDKCPELPVPRVVAWSFNGRKIEVMDGRIEFLDDEFVQENLNRHHSGWILMTQLPGRRLEIDDLAGDNGRRAARQLGEMVNRWRCACGMKDIGMGNFRLSGTVDDKRCPGTVVHEYSAHRRKLYSSVTGPLLTHRKSIVPLLTALDFYVFHACDQLEHFKSSPLFLDAQNRDEMMEFAKDVIQNVMPSMPCWKQFKKSHAILTHMDLSPRNILVEPDPDHGGPLKITGIVDWEFAGLMPEVEEWLNCEVSQKGDWPEDVWRELMKAVKERDGMILENVGESDSLRTLREVIDAIAPW